MKPSCKGLKPCACDGSCIVAGVDLGRPKGDQTTLYRKADDGSFQVIAKSRGFAGMNPMKQRLIASKGGQSVASKNRAFSKDRSLAAEAGRKGGRAAKKEGPKE